MSSSPSSEYPKFESYSAESITKKNGNKDTFFEHFHIQPKSKALLVGLIITPEHTETQMNIINEMLQGLAHVPYVQLVVMSTKELKHKHVLCTYNAEILPAFDAMLVLDESLDKVEKHIAEAHRKGVVTVAHVATKDNGILTEYNPYREKGESLFFTEVHPWNILATLMRVHEIYKFPYDWNTIRRNAMHNS